MSIRPLGKPLLAIPVIDCLIYLLLVNSLSQRCAIYDADKPVSCAGNQSDLSRGTLLHYISTPVLRVRISVRRVLQPVCPFEDCPAVSDNRLDTLFARGTN